MTDRGSLIVLSGPSGAGKDTVLGPLLKELGNLTYSVSATTREPRPGEVGGKHYHFITRERFEALVKNGEMLEHAQYGGNLYGTPKRPTDEMLAAGTDVLLVIEVQGALQVKAQRPEAIMIFLAPPSVSALEARLRGRATESDEAIAERLLTAKRELEQAENYDYIVINEDIVRAKDEIASIIRAARCRVESRRGLLSRIKER
ncbi:MAG TPA: guanylate kinase [Terriglobales bacterium]|nr:guanylate kinase [Terriglobales bacterium]